MRVANNASGGLTSSVVGLLFTPTAVNEPGLGTLQFYRKAEVGNFHMWGATGSDAAAPSNHLQYIGGLMNNLPLAKLTPPAADFDGNYTVNAADLAKWRSARGADG